ncbi:hypothetical protein [Micromonospora maris]|uniref:hypothetical protein n=1 Tax=Micromonospora maris TaxID=1003110 RepID=UPI002E11E8F6|nr:hypothetical protein OG712_02125 [Micromonospora maris]
MSGLEIQVYSNPLLALHPNTPIWGVEDYSTFVQYDVELLKPALLFGDKVNLVTFRETMQEMTYSQAKTLFQMPMPRVAQFVQVCRRRDQRELEALGLDIRELPTPEEAAEGWESIGRRDQTFWAKYDELIERAAKNAYRIWVERHRALEGNALEAAISRGYLSTEGWLPPFPRDWSGGLLVNLDEMFDASLDEFVDRLAVADQQPMLDAGANWVLENWPGTDGLPRQSMDQPVDWRSTSNLVAQSMMRLPGLERLSLVDVIDLREELSDYLPAFRSEMLKLGDDIAGSGNSSSEEVANEVERRWHRDIAPSLVEIRREVVEASYPRRLLNSLTGEKDSLIAVGGAFMLGAGSVAAGLSTLIPAAAAAAYPFVRAARDSLAAKSEAQKNRLYFLYKLEEGIARRLQV